MNRPTRFPARARFCSQTLATMSQAAICALSFLTGLTHAADAPAATNAVLSFHATPFSLTLTNWTQQTGNNHK